MEQKNALFEQMPVRKAFFKLALPVVLSMVVSLVYNMVDTYFIAKTGNAHLVAGVALGSPVFTLMIAVGDIFGLGGSSFISRLFGQKRDPGWQAAERVLLLRCVVYRRGHYGAAVAFAHAAADDAGRPGRHGAVRPGLLYLDRRRRAVYHFVLHPV